MMNIEATPEQMDRAKRIVSENWPGSWSELNSYHAVAVDCAISAILQSDQQLMEARTLVAEANNSLYGSQNYFHSTNGGPFDKHHLARPIEALKERARKADQQQAELLSAAIALRDDMLMRARVKHTRTGGDLVVEAGAGVWSRFNRAIDRQYQEGRKNG